MKFIVVLVGQARTFGASGRFHLKSLEGLPKGACRSTSTSAHTFHCETWNSHQRSSLWGCSSIVSRDVNSVSCNVSCSILTDDMSLSFTTDYLRSSTLREYTCHQSDHTAAVRVSHAFRGSARDVLVSTLDGKPSAIRETPVA